ncbi:MAG TPA: DEAD/DEAH box helicase, partial [Sneathiellales bacterium]|nr:DEAD/DEAH box helicase [Sneathiellales bacterium]
LAAGRARARMARTLILEPTRELAAQISENFEVYGKYQKLTMALLIGGVSFKDQERKLDRGVDVLIATPGRLLDHFERGKLMLTGVQVLVIDEADRMLDMGFIPDVERICKLISGKRQTLLFSATMPKEIQKLADSFMSNPARVEVAPPSSPVENVEQRIVYLSPQQKDLTLRKIIKAAEVQTAIIFCNRKRDVDALFKSLKSTGLSVAALHGDMAQSYRMEVLANFKAGDVPIMIASDVAARGLDIAAVSHVFNYDVPTQPEDYIHRIGRTARAGRSGHAITFATPQEQKYVDAIVKLIGTEIPQIDTPGIKSTSPINDEQTSPQKRGRSIKKS